MVGLWLLVPEHLRLGTWDLLRGWTGASGDSWEPRVAMQMVHEAALCISGLRDQRSLTQNDFALLNGLGGVASDPAVHALLDSREVSCCQAMQVALGRIRHSLGHFDGSLLAIDPHRLTSYTQRRTRLRKAGPRAAAGKTLQTFFCLDAGKGQPLCFATGSAARTVSQATPPLLEMAREILGPAADGSLVMADTEHFTAELLDHVATQTPFDLLTPMPRQAGLVRQIKALSEESFHRCWAGLAMAQVPYTPANSQAGPYQMIVQRFGEDPKHFDYNSFLCTSRRPEVDMLTRDYPQRWHIEEFFNTDQYLGWHRAGTQNLHIRYGRMTMALLAQAALSQLRKRLGPTERSWNAKQFAEKVLRGLDGDVRVQDDRVLVTFYDAGNIKACREQFEHLPERLAREGVDPRVPWLYNYRLDFRFC